MSDDIIFGIDIEADGAEETLDSLSQTLGDLEAGMKDIGAGSFDELQKSVSDLSEDAKVLDADMDDIRSDSIDDLRKAVSEADENTRSLDTEMSKLSKDLTSLDTSEMDELQRSMANAVQDAIEFGGSIDDLDKNLKDISSTDPFKNIKKSISLSVKSTDSFFTSFKKGFVATSKSSDSLAKSIKGGVIGTLDNAAKKAKGFKENFSSSFKAALHPIKTLKSKITDAFDSGAKSSKEFGDEASENIKDTASATDKLVSGLKKIAVVAAGIAVVTKAVGALKNAIVSAAEAGERLDQANKTLDATFKDNADNAGAWAQNFGKEIHRSEAEVKSFLSSTKSMFDGMDMSEELGLDMSKITTSLTFDIARDFKMDDADVLADMESAISGSEDALLKYGVKLDEVTLKEQARQMGIRGELKDLDEATQAQIRLNSILEQTGDLHGKASKSLGGFSGGMKAIKAVGEDMLAKVGDKFAPVFGKLFGLILDKLPIIEPMIMKAADLLVSSLDSFIPIISDLADQLLPVLFEAFENIVPPILQLAEDLFPIFADILAELLPPIADLAQQLLPVLADVLSMVFSALSPLIPPFTKLLKAIIEPILPLFEVLVSALLPPLVTLLESVLPIIELLIPPFEFFVEIITQVVEWLGKLIGKVSDFLGSGIGKIGDFVGGLFGGGSKVASNATGTTKFEGGLTQINEAGSELIRAGKTDMAILPKDSTIVPANKSDDLLSALTDLLNQGSQLDPSIIENNTTIIPPPEGRYSDETEARNEIENEPTLKKEIIIRFILEATGSENLSDIPEEVFNKFREIAKEVFKEIRDDEIDDDIIQFALQ